MSIKRTLSAILLIVVAYLAIINDWVFIAVIVSLTMGGLYEFFSMVKKKDIPIYSYVGIFIGVAIPVSIFSGFELTKNWELLFIVLAFLLILLLQFARQDNRNAIVGISTTLFGVLYIAWFLSFLVKIRLLLPGMDGIKLLAFLILVTKMGDIGALLVGENFGKHPLFPRVSPNKSVEGAIGSLVFSIITAIAVKSFLPPPSHFSMLPSDMTLTIAGKPIWAIIPHFSIFQVAAIGAFFGAVGQLGDLSESLIKRDCNVKDSGNLFPGMGGVMDVIDSLLFSAPAFYLYMSSTLTL